MIKSAFLAYRYFDDKIPISQSIQGFQWVDTDATLPKRVIRMGFGGAVCDLD